MVKRSQYEIDREANIARNRALLEQLELKQAVDDLGIPAKSKLPPKIKAKPIQPTKKAKQDVADVPRRMSTRLRSGGLVDPNESPSKKRKREAEIEEQRAKEAEERIEAEERARIAKKPRHHELDLRTLAEDDANLHDASSLASQLQNIEQQTKRLVDIDAYAFEKDEQDEECMKELREKLQGLKVISRAKVTQDRVYSAAYHPEVTKDLIFFGDKHGQLVIWDARAPAEEVADDDDDITADDREGGKYWRLQAHWPATSKSSISSVKIDPFNSHTVYTSSYDCTVRSLSFTSGVSREIYSSEDVLLCSIDLVPTGQEMWISDAAGGLTHLDLRQPMSKAQWYGLSDQKIGCVSVNPIYPNFLLTASNNRTLKIWDIRKLQALSTDGMSEATITPPPSPGGPGEESGEEDIPRTQTTDFDSEAVAKFLDSKKGFGCLRGEWRHNKSVSSAFWDPRGRSIVSTSYDDTIRIWDIKPSAFKTNGSFPSSRPFSHIKHNCQTGKWLTILRAQWSQNTDVYPHFTIGNMNHSLDVFSAKGDLIARLSDKTKITAVQAVTCSHPCILERAVSGNASGRCVLWAPADLE